MYKGINLNAVQKFWSVKFILINARSTTVQFVQIVHGGWVIVKPKEDNFKVEAALLSLCYSFHFFQFGVPDGRVRRRICGAVGDIDILLPQTIQDGCKQQKATLHPRRHQLYLSQRRNCAFPPSNILEGSYGENGVMAYSGTGYVFRWGFGIAFLVVSALIVSVLKLW